MARKIRIGKDFRCRFEVLTDGQALPLDGRSLILEVGNRWGRTTMPFTIIGNAIEVQFYGKDSRQLGEYSLTLWENLGAVGQTVVDICHAFDLVAYSCQEDDMGVDGLDIEAVDLGSVNLALSHKGDSAYETWLKLGHEGTEADFIAWLRQPSVDAAVQATEAASKAMEAAQSAGQAVESIQRLDEAVTLSENKRAAAERDRVTAEAQRATAEVQRQQATTDAIELMQTATSEAVQSVKDEASATLSNVQSEASTTINRVQTESTSAIRDVQATASDSIKAIKDESTVTLNKVQTDSQTAIEATNQAVSEAVSKANTATGKATEAATRAEAAAAGIDAKIATKLEDVEQSLATLETFAGGGNLRDLYIAAGAKWNAKTGFYELNGITDIDEKEMRQIYAAYNGERQTDFRTKFENATFRTHIPIKGTWEIFDCGRTFSYSKIEVANVTAAQEMKECNAMFYSAKQIVRIMGRLIGRNWGSQSFQYCEKLQEVNIAYLKADIDFSWSPLLNNASIRYMIENSSPNSSTPFTIKLHPQAFVRASADAEIQTLLAQKTHISLTQA